MATTSQRPVAAGDRPNDGSRRISLVLALVLILGIMIAEIIGGMLSGSLVLLADAGHMLATASAIGIALFASWAESQPASIERTFGFHRAEVVGAMLSALALWLVAAWVLFESIRRLQNQSDIEIESGLMLAIGIVGLVVNVFAAGILGWGGRRSDQASDALQHLLADLLASVGVVAAAMLVLVNEWAVVDPIVSIGIAALTAASSWRLILKVFHTLLEGTPDRIDLYQLCADMEDVPGVTLVHDVHAWTIRDNYDAFTAHVIIEPGYHDNAEALLTRMREIVYEKHNVSHLTVQFEESATSCLEDHHLGHLEARSRFD